MRMLVSRSGEETEQDILKQSYVGGNHLRWDEYGWPFPISQAQRENRDMSTSHTHNYLLSPHEYHGNKECFEIISPIPSIFPGLSRGISVSPVLPVPSGSH